MATIGHKKICIGICVSALIVSSIYVVKWLVDWNTSNQNESDIQELVETNSLQGDYKMLPQTYIQLKEKYPKLVGYIEFENDFISEPIVQSDDNFYYLDHWINDSYSEQGSIYLDSNCNSTNQNMTIYGHHVMYDDSAKFSPLTRLVDQDCYESHKYFKIWYDTYVSEYEIIYVVYYDTNSDSEVFDYTAKNFYTEEMYQEYISWLNNHQLIESNTNISKTDRLVTLSTCKDASSTIRVLVVSKEINKETY